MRIGEGGSEWDVSMMQTPWNKPLVLPVPNSSSIGRPIFSAPNPALYSSGHVQIQKAKVLRANRLSCSQKL